MDTLTLANSVRHMAALLLITAASLLGIGTFSMQNNTSTVFLSSIWALHALGNYSEVNHEINYTNRRGFIVGFVECDASIVKDETLMTDFEVGLQTLNHDLVELLT